MSIILRTLYIYIYVCVCVCNTIAITIVTITITVNTYTYTGKQDVMVATDVASKSLDFPNIQHVINFDMPSEIENYVHRIGRTGRSGRTGIATTFINKSVDESIQLDLKHLLEEAKQNVPIFLMEIESELESHQMIGGVRGCAYCSGLGHRITNCPKLEGDQTRSVSSRRDILADERD